MTIGYDAVVVGAGLVGAACAEALALSGRRILVLDTGPAGAGATAAGMGHVVLMDDSPAQIALTARGRQLWRQREADWPTDAGYHTCGTLWVAADDREMETVEAKRDRYEAAGAKAEVIDASRLSVLEPALRPGLAGGLSVPDDVVVYPPSVVHRLLRHERITLREFARVEELTPKGPILEGGEWIPTRLTVNAAGIDAARLTPGLPVRSRQGHLVITDRYPGLVRHQLIELGYPHKAHGVEETSVAFNVQPRPNGQLLVGSSRQFDAEKDTVDPDLLASMLRRATAYLPSLSEVSALRVWTGCRAASPDGLPLVGPHPDADHLWIATGHEGLGITTALVTGELLAALVDGHPPPLEPEPFRVDRFRPGGRE